MGLKVKMVFSTFNDEVTVRTLSCAETSSAPLMQIAISLVSVFMPQPGVLDDGVNVCSSRKYWVNKRRFSNDEFEE